MTLLLGIGVATFVATLLGGLFALKLRDKLHLVTGFSAGAIIGVAFFDLLPETFALRSSSAPLMIGAGFVVYMILDRMIIFHAPDENRHAATQHRGILGAGSLSLHSFLDGVIIGLAFQVSSALGIIVTTAILTHDFSDGINTVAVVLRGTGERKQALSWLAVDALAPVLGIGSTLLYSIPESALGLILGVFCGFFIYIGASDLLPESHHAHPKKLTTFMTLLGMVLLYVVIQIAQ
jgi:zinc transporter ZupT